MTSRGNKGRSGAGAGAAPGVLHPDDQDRVTYVGVPRSSDEDNGESSESNNNNDGGDDSNKALFFFRPQVSGQGIVREFEGQDMMRVHDFDNLKCDPPSDGQLLFGEETSSNSWTFRVYHFCLRGGYLFYFDVNDVDEDSGPYAIFVGPPAGVVPLDNIVVQFPPGGRRVFREHAHTEARTGYELVMLHNPKKDGDEPAEIRPPQFLVTDSMGLREKWADALRERASISKPTFLRGGYSAAASGSAAAQRLAAAAAVDDADDAAASGDAATDAFARDRESNKQARKSSLAFGSKTKKQHDKALEKLAGDIKDDAELAAAVMEFGAAHFDEKVWMDDFFSINNDFDAPSKLRQMEQYQGEMKKSLKGAVLEQYEYFVQASGEMTTMGKEVTSLKTLIETQLDTIKDMKEIDFGAAINTKMVEDGGAENGEDIDDLPDDEQLAAKARLQDPYARIQADLMADDDRSVLSDVSSYLKDKSADTVGDGSAENNNVNESAESGVGAAEAESAPPIDVPDWLDDVAEEISAVAREGRYQDAVELFGKARAEIADLMEKHERPTLYKLTKKQLSELRRLQRTLDQLQTKLCGRLEETLRRKNEALRQASKRERSDPNATLNVVSPVAVHDDAHHLRMLVRLGKAQTAADAYAARRSLLLFEALSERPISGAGSVDLVIYAAQLSQSFFSCLANSVEGFLDLFMSSSAAANEKAHGGDADADSLADSSLHSHNSSLIKSAPSGAVASVVLWCDAELAKFANAFGGTRILANLALSPPPRDGGAKKPRVVGQDTADEAGMKDRKNAIDVASQCIDQAFLYATQNLDSVGLPLAPRLAEYVRVRLKGCEAEVARQLDDRWQHLTVDWITYNGGGDSHGNGMSNGNGSYQGSRGNY